MDSSTRRQSFYESVLNSVHDGLWVTDENDRLVFFNRSMETIAGVAATDVLGISVVDDFPPETNRQFLDYYLKAKASLEPESYEAEVITPAGRHTIQAGWITPLIENDRFAGMICTIQDVTENRETARKLNEEAQRAQRYLDIAPAIILALNPDGTIRLLNQEGARLLECSVDEAIGIDWFETFLPPESGSEVRKVFRKLIEGDLEDSEEYTNEIRTRQTNRSLIVCWHNTLIRDEDGRITGLLSSGLDVTASKRAEQEQRLLLQQLAQSQKMESIGRLAGGVAHDFNNMLNIILGHSELALDSLSTENPLFDDLDTIRKAAKRSADLTRQLTTFARRQTLVTRVLDLNTAIENMLQMLGRLIGEDIRLEWKPAAELAPVRVDPSQIDQMLVNLIVNARDAIEGNGTITITTKEVEILESRNEAQTSREPGRYVLLSISDTGHGMDQETLSHIFEPFFTTKEVGQGTGLGLATIYGMVKQSGGFIDVVSEPDRGTVFHIHLPVAVEPSLPTEVQHGKPEESARGRGTILLVEDEPAILSLCTRMLKKMGYEVLPAESPGEALRTAEAYGKTIHLIISDIVMPEMNGRELVERLQKRLPQTKHLFMSGYTADVIASKGILEEGLHFLQKPFTKKELADQVRQALNDD